METTDSFSASILRNPWVVFQLVFYGNHGELISYYFIVIKDSCSASISREPCIVVQLAFYGNHG